MSVEMDESHPASESLPDAPAKQTFRSFKKKYAKMKIRFELGMRESEDLIREELRIEDLSKRIQAQNDQLLEVLMEFNDSIHIAPKKRFDLNAPEDPPSQRLQDEADDIPALDNLESAVDMLKVATADLADKRISVEEYRRVENTVKRRSAFGPKQHYKDLRVKPHEPLDALEENYAAGGNMEDSLGYLTPEYETEYYLATDARLGDEAAALQATRVPEKPTFAERERERTMRNPASVYNWLRRNQPQLLQDHDNASEKSGSRPSNQRSSKKSQARKDDDHFDDDTVSMEAGPTSNPRSKRKRDDDATPKAKGGNTRSRKKKEDGATPSSRRAPKRASGVGAGGAAATAGSGANAGAGAAAAA